MVFSFFSFLRIINAISGYYLFTIFPTGKVHESANGKIRGSGLRTLWHSNEFLLSGMRIVSHLFTAQDLEIFHLKMNRAPTLGFRTKIDISHSKVAFCLLFFPRFPSFLFAFFYLFSSLFPFSSSSISLYLLPILSILVPLAFSL